MAQRNRMRLTLVCANLRNIRKRRDRQRAGAAAVQCDALFQRLINPPSRAARFCGLASGSDVSLAGTASFETLGS